MTMSKLQTLYKLLVELEDEHPAWLSLATVKALVKALIRLTRGNKK